MDLKFEMPGTLSKVIKIPTNVPFPKDKNGTEPQNRGSVSLAVCSEFTEYSAPIQPFEACKRLALVSDTLGQPVVFAIGSDDRLHCLVHINGGAHGWKLFDITPDKVNKIATFDLVEESAEINFIHVAVAAVSVDGTSTIHHASFPIPATTLEKNNLVGFEPQSIKWVAVNNNEGPKKISYLLVGPKPRTPASLAPFLITAGSEHQSQKNITATHYTIDPSPGVQMPWKTFAFSRDADRILEIQPAKLENNFGIYVLFEQEGATECVIDVFDNGGNWTNTNIVLVEKCGKVRSMFSNINPWGMTDLFFATEKGLGFVNTKRDTSAVQMFAENMSFRQVVASEAIDPDHPGTQCKFTIFALSDQNELHYIQGTRQFKGNKVDFENSGFPIRTGIECISCQFNAETNASEVLYLDKKGATLKHLMRDPVTTCWRENLLNFQAPTKVRTFPAFVTTIAVKDSEGQPAGTEFPIEIQSEAILVTANDQAYTLSRKPTVIHTDSMGQVSIVTPAADTLSSPIFDVTIRNEGKSVTHKVYAGQRVMERLCAIKTAEDFANARAVDGTSVFSEAERREYKEGFQASGELFKNLPSMVGAIDDNAKRLIDPGSVKSNLTVVLEHNGFGNSTISQATDWWSEKAQDISRFAGDALEWMRGELKSFFKCAFKVVGKVVRFAIEIAGKVFSAAVDTLETLFPALTSFLKNAVRAGIDKLMSLLGYRLDIARIKQTQEVLIATFKAAQLKTNGFMKTNKKAITAGFDLARDKIDDYIADQRPIPKSPTGKKSILSWLFDNPILKLLMRFNPLSIMIEAASEAMEEEFGDTFKIPDFSSLIRIFAETIPAAIETQMTNLMRLVDSLKTRLSTTLAEPRRTLDQLQGVLADFFWTIFDAVQSLILTFWDVMTGVLEQAFELISGVWKIPYVTSIFEHMTGQEYSFLNVVSFVGAAFLNMVVGDEKKLPFDVLGRPDVAVNSLQDKDFDLKGLFREAVMKMAPPTHSQVSLVTTNANVNALSRNTSSSTPPTNPTHDGKRVSENPSQAGAGGTPKTYRNPSQYKKVQHTYHSAKQYISTLVGLARMVAAAVEVPLAFTHAVPDQVGAKGMHETVSGVAAIASTLVTIGRILDLGFWLGCRAASEDLKEELDENFWVLLIGHLVGTATSIGGTICLFRAYAATNSEVSIIWMTRGNVILNIGCGLDVILVHLVAEWHEDHKTAFVLRIADGAELTACVLGTATSIVSYFAHIDEEPESKAILSQVAVGSAAGDFFASLISLVITATSISAYEEHDEKH